MRVARCKYENKKHTGVALEVKQDPDEDLNLKGNKQ